jgi:hypothetical protein
MQSVVEGIHDQITRQWSILKSVNEGGGKLCFSRVRAHSHKHWALSML